MREIKLLKSILKAIKIIDIISTEKKGLNLKQISSLLNINISTIHHIISTLLAARWITKDEKKYYLGPRILELASNYFDNLPNYDKLLPHIKSISDKFKENVSVILCDEASPILIERFVCSNLIRPMHFYPSLDECHAAAWGKLWLSTFTDEKLFDHIKKYKLTKFTDNTITELEELFKELKKIKNDGYSFDNEERYKGLYCVAKKMPIKTISNKVTLIVIFEIPKQRFASDIKMEIINSLNELTEISASL